MPCRVHGLLERQSMNRFPPASSAALGAAAALGTAAALLRRLLRHRAVERAVAGQAAGTGAPPVVAAADTDSPAETLESNEAEESAGLPTRTWVVDNSSNWDGSPLELVVTPGNGSRPGPEWNERRERNGHRPPGS